MPVDLFNPKLLNFLFELSQKGRFMSYRAMSREIALENGKRLSEKTMQSWLKFLESPDTFTGQKLCRKFVYHPNFIKEYLELEYFYAFVNDAKMDFLQAFPHVYHIVWVYDARRGCKTLVVSFLVPKAGVPSFRKTWKRLKRSGTIGRYKLHNFSTPYIIYSPWHKVVDRSGTFYPERNDDAILDRQISGFSKYWSSLPSCRMHHAVKNNPLIIPVLFEYDKESLSSIEAWERMKSRMGENIWHYIKKKGREQDAVGIKRVQQAMREAYANSLFHQVRVDYDPLELNNLWVYIYMKFSGKKSALDEMASLCRKSLVTYLYPEKGTANIFIAALTNQRAMQDFFDVVSGNSLQVHRTFFVLHSKSYELMHKYIHSHINYWLFFDPENCRWLVKNRF